MPRHAIRRFCVTWAALLVGATLAFGPAARAAIDSSWTGSTGFWSDPANWSDGVPNGVDHIARITSAYSGTVTLDAAVGDAVTLGQLHLANASRTLSCAAAQCLVFQATSAWATLRNEGEAYAVFNTPVVLDTPTVFDINGSPVELHGSLSGAPGIGLRKTGTESLWATSHNAYTGDTEILGGRFGITYGDGLGIGTATVTVGRDAALVLYHSGSGSHTIAGKQLVVCGVGPDGEGAIQVREGKYTWDGTAVLTGDTAIGCLVKPVTKLTITGWLTDRGEGYALTKSGTGSLVLGGGALHAGPTDVLAGQLHVSRTLGIGPAGVSVANGASLVLEGDVTVSGKPLRLRVGGGPPDTAAEYAMLAKNGTSVWNGPVCLEADTVISVENGTLTIGGTVDGAFRLSSGGWGALALTGANTYAGQTRVEGSGLLRAVDGIGLPAQSNLVLSRGTFEGLGPTTFTRPLGDGPGQVRWDAAVSVTAGFSAHGGPMVVNLGGLATPPMLCWGVTPYFVSSDTSALRFGSNSADSETRFRHPLDLGGKVHDFSVMDNTNVATDVAVLEGAITNGGIRKWDEGTLVLAAANSYADETQIWAGAIRAADGVGLPTASNLVLYYGVLESDGPTTFTRPLGTGPGQFRWADTWSGNGGGFSAHGGKMTVNIGGAASPQTLRWMSTPHFLSDWFNYQSLVFGSQTADSETEFRNPIDLNSRVAIVTVRDNPSADTDFATISGQLSNGGLQKQGDGTLVLTATNTYTQGTRVTSGALRAVQGVGLPNGGFLSLGGTGVYEGVGVTSFNRALGTGAGQVRLTAGGFAAWGGKMTVNLGGNATPSTFTWGTTASFLADGEQLVFGSGTADSEVEFRNPIDLGGGERTVLVRDNPFSPGDWATLSGSLSNGGLRKEGDGILALTGANAYTGPTTVLDGVLRLGSWAMFASTWIDVRSGATLEYAGTNWLRIPPGGQLQGGGTIVGDVLVGGTAAPGEGLGTLHVRQAAFRPGSVLEIELERTGLGPVCDRLVCDQQMLLAAQSTLNISAPGVFLPAANDVFDILDFSESTGTFTTLNLPELPGGLAWNTDRLYTDGVLEVVPEPTTLALLALGALALRRRRT